MGEWPSGSWRPFKPAAPDFVNSTAISMFTAFINTNIALYDSISWLCFTMWSIKFGVYLLPILCKILWSLCNGLFTRNVCVNINVNFNIVLIVMQTHTQRTGLKPIPCVNQWHNVKVDVDIDANGHAYVTCKQSLKRHHVELRSVFLCK